MPAASRLRKPSAMQAIRKRPIRPSLTLKRLVAPCNTPPPYTPDGKMPAP